MSRGERIKRYLREFNGGTRIKGMEINCMPPTGDCFYCAVEEALYSAKAFYIAYDTRVIPDVSFLRHIVADSIDYSVFESYQIYYQSEIDGLFSFCLSFLS